MAKNKKQFVCSDCGTAHPKWMGKCSDCDAWNTLEEYIETKDTHRGHAAAFSQNAPKAVAFREIIKQGDLSAAARMSTNIGELDRVLGGQAPSHSTQIKKQTKSPPPSSATSHEAEAPSANSLAAHTTANKQGIVPGSAVLLGGDPGIGKSTLLLQAACKMAAKNIRVLYVTSEESAHQLHQRAMRLGAIESQTDELFILADTNLARIMQQVRKVEPAVMIIDSIQMIYNADLPAAPGSVTQLRACCLELVYLAKASNCAVMLVGHVTKEGRLAGPRLLEHMVDTVLYFEGDRYHSHRIVRAIKNRFGNTLEVGLFEMTERGLQEVVDGSGLLAAEYQPSNGSVICPVLQGSRCLLVEVQALTATGFLGAAKRKTSGLDASRLAMLIAVLEKRAELRLADQDIFASVVGGMKVVEPALDLALALAIAGAFTNKRLNHAAGMVGAFGEIGLGGEIRHVQQPEQRITEAARLGFTRLILPHGKYRKHHGCELIQVRNIEQAIEVLD